ncbi:MAG: hypoxanthine phosphoribosyltransferase [Planctomycetota bacterium]|nr:hypoxanthine phosphoribosyltransferase [Planctomycetota bacterium]MDA1212317.1 hypoxanthine phosphoribosyltransferase [Planctomycetota bacterium]
MRVLLSTDEIDVGVSDLAGRIQADYTGQSLTVLGVLTGSLVFLADLIRKLDLPLRVGVLQASSYRGETKTAGQLILQTAMLPDIVDRDVLLVDDIFDTGRTLATIFEQMQSHRPRSLRSAVLLWKEERTIVEYRPDYHVFRIPDKFVVGYGLDYDDQYRHLPHIAAYDEM